MTELDPADLWEKFTTNAPMATIVLVFLVALLKIIHWHDNHQLDMVKKYLRLKDREED